MPGSAGPDDASDAIPPVVGWREDDLDLLWREHVADARRLALLLAGPNDADELVAEAFARVLTRLRAGRGPTTSFRAYLHVTIRNTHRDRQRRGAELPVSDQPWLLDQEHEPDEADESAGSDGSGTDPGIADTERAARAFASLPDAWQQVLWHVEVEGRRPRELVGVLGLRARAVSSLAHRAREGLRTAYLDQHVVEPGPTEECGWIRSRLGQYVRDQASRRTERRIARHLETCADCVAVSLQVEQANRRLAALLGPAVLLGALPVAGGGAVPGASTGASSSSLGSAALVGVGTTAAAAVAIAVAVVVAVTGDVPGRDEPAARTPGATTSLAPEVPALPPRADDAALRPSLGLGPGPGPEPEPAPGDPSDPSDREVRPEAPVASPVGRACDTVGRLVLPRVPGVRYELTRGDGRTGPWTVRARAAPGNRLAPGARTTFQGDLGALLPCVGLVSAQVRALSGPRPLLKGWRVEVGTELRDARSRPLRIDLRLRDVAVVAIGHPRDGWVCRSSSGLVLGEAGELVLAPDPSLLTVGCTTRRAGPATTTVGLTVWTLDLGGGRARPTGEVTLSSEGRTLGERPLSSD